MSDNASTTPLGIDPSTLNESEQQLIDLFESRRSSASSEGDATAPVSAEELPEPTGTPGSTDSPTAASEPTPPVEGQAVGSENAPSPSPEVEPVATVAPVDGEPTVEDQASTSAAFTFAGINYDEATLTRAVQVHDWFSRLDNNQTAAIDALLSGQYRLVPASAPDQPIATPPATPPATSSPDITQDDGGEWLDPRAQSEIARLQSELNSMREQFTGAVTPLVQSQVDQQLNQRRAAIDSAAAAFQTTYSLDEATMQNIGQAVVQTGVLPSLITQHNGNVEAATRQAFEMMFWTTPSFRDSYMQAKSAADLADLAAQDKAEADKHRKLTALTASGGSTPRRDPSPSNKDERHTAMVDLIRADMNGS